MGVSSEESVLLKLLSLKNLKYRSVFKSGSLQEFDFQCVYIYMHIYVHTYTHTYFPQITHTF